MPVTRRAATESGLSKPAACAARASDTESGEAAMSMTRQNILASRPAAMLLALALIAVFTVPFVMLTQLARAAAGPLPCTEGNHNGCTELSPTPPQDMVSVPPNITLMLDDSGSMAWDFMPDWDYLPDTGKTKRQPNGIQAYDGVRDSGLNGLYYNPATVYTPPPKADGSLYPDSPGLTNAFKDGFLDTSAQNVTLYTGGGDGNSFDYFDNLPTTQFNPGHDYGQAVWGGASPGGCPAGYHPDPNNPNQCIRDPVSPTTTWTCNPGDSGPTNHGGNPHMCRHTEYVEGQPVYTWYQATQGSQCPGGSSLQGDGLCHYPPKPKIPPTPDHWICPSGGNPVPPNAPPPPAQPPECLSNGSRIYVKVFAYATGPKGNYHRHYIASGTNCSILYYTQDQTDCVNEGDTSGTSAPAGVTAGQNVANWFSYYRTRLLMSKSGLMTAFTKLDPGYRFGFASINANGVSNIPGSPAPYAFDDSYSGGGSSNNKLAVVQPYGDGSNGTQKAKFWNWLANESANNGTPLRRALQAAGEYYKTAQPWTTMPGDPGYTNGSDTKFACRASYTILTTDGFWNDTDPTGIGYAAGSDGPVQTVPTGDMTQYKAQPPFSGGGVGGSVPSLADVATYYWENDLSDMPNEVSPSTADPAAWQHMATFTVGLGFTPAGIQPPGTTQQQIFAWAQGGAAIPGFSWPTPASNSLNNIADLEHAAVNGRGDFFNVTSPQDLAAAFAKAISDISARQSSTPAASVNASVLSLGALSFSTGYDTKDWSGTLSAVTLKNDGSIDQTLWKAETILNSDFHGPSFTNRKVYSAAYDSTKPTPFTSFQFTAGNVGSLDGTETAGLSMPALSSTDSNDTLVNRINYLLGDSQYEGSTYRARSNILGAIIRSAPVYVAGATGNYYQTWPTIGGIAPPEATNGAQSYDDFVTQQSTAPGMVYVGANDGMLHAFNSPVPTCSGTIDSDGNCSLYTFPGGTNPGKEAWAFVPRAVYTNLGNLTNAANFTFLPTVDGTPVRRDVFFSEGTRNPNYHWHTILVGGVGLGGRGVYALDITDPAGFSASDVLWELDSDMNVDAGCVASYGTCRSSDLGFTVSEPNIGRLSNGKWVALVPNGYFPDCQTPDTPTGSDAQCNAIANEVPKDTNGNPYSALFVLDAETGKMIAELKTPTNISGVISFGLAKPVLGDYQNDQVDDVAFAGDVQGNLWRFDLSATNPSNWTVTLVYKGLSDANGQGVQPITTMPRLFPDPSTNRFIVMFGTGKFLGVGDNSNTVVQSVYGVRDDGSTYAQSDLVQQYLHESVVPPGQPNEGSTLRCVTGSANDSSCLGATTPVNDVPVTSGGWFINLYTTTSGGVHNDAGERVVVNPGAIFASNTVVFESLITGSQSSDPCNPSTQGAIMALNAATGAPAGASSLGGGAIVGGRINNARTSGDLPIVSALGGGQAYLPGATLAPSGTSPLSVDAPIWRRRSWQEIQVQ